MVSISRLKASTLGLRGKVASAQRGHANEGSKTVPAARPWSTRATINLQPRLRTLPMSRAVARVAVPSIGGVAVKSAQVLRFKGARMPSTRVAALTTLDVQFGALSAQSFATLAKTFGNQSRVRWVEGREYGVIDFLPPALQAVVNRDVELPEPLVLKGTRTWDVLPQDEDKSVVLAANCHGTAWEAMRAFQGADSAFAVFGGSNALTQLAVQDGTRFKKVAEVDAVKLGSLKLRPGDVVQFYRPDDDSLSALQHSSVHVGGGLFFEKADNDTPTADFPYRLALAPMVLEPLVSREVPRLIARAYRPTVPLPDAEAVFGADLGDVSRPKGQPLLSIPVYSGDVWRGEFLGTLARLPVALGPDGRGVIKQPPLG